MNELHTDADLYISQAGNCSNLKEIKSLLAETTSLRKTVKEKDQEVLNCNDTIRKLARPLFLGISCCYV